MLALLLLAPASIAGAGEALERTPSPEGARVYFIGIADGDEVASPVMIRFGLSDMGVAPAGTVKEKTGHHHLLIDTKLDDPTLPIPSDAQHRHFGGGQTEGSFELPAGEHTLQLVLADYRHLPHDPPVTSETITITVK
jgi:hypothetical protein